VELVELQLVVGLLRHYSAGGIHCDNGPVADTRSKHDHPLLLDKILPNDCLDMWGMELAEDHLSHISASLAFLLLFPSGFQEELSSYRRLSLLAAVAYHFH